MNKEKFIENFSPEEKNSAVKIYNCIDSVIQYGVPAVSDEFFTPNIWFKVQKLAKSMGVCCEADGFFTNCERRELIFWDKGYDFEIEKNYDVLKVYNKSKFKTLEHKNYLGTILSLGIVREKIGDMILSGRECVFPVSREIGDFIKMSLEKINGCAVDVTSISEEDRSSIKDMIQLEERVLLTTSMRVDCLISSITNASRSKADKLLQSKKVLVNYVEVTKKNYEVPLGSTITIRGFGKFIVKEIVGETKKDRLRVLIQKFCG